MRDDGILTLLDPSARSIALGGAMCAVNGSPESVHYNPAGLVGLDRLKTGATFDIRTDDLAKPVLTVALPLIRKRLFFSYTAFMLTSIEDHWDDRYVREDISFGWDPDFAGMHTLALSGSPFDGFSIGAAFKFIMFTGDFSDELFCLDLGFHVSIPGTTIRLGMAMQNIYLQINPEHGPDSLPYIFRFGAAWGVLNDFDHTVTVSADYIKAEEHNWEYGIGAEYTLMDKYLVRIGFHKYDSLPRFGIGYRNKTVDISLEIDITYQKNSQTDGVYSFTFLLGF